MVGSKPSPKHLVAWILAFACLSIPPHAADTKAVAANARSRITVHVLDTMLGKPAAGIVVILAQRGENGWRELARGRAGDDGRVETLLRPGASLRPGVYRITYLSGPYFAARRNVKTFYPEVQVIFEVTEPEAPHHLPLLLSPHGYTTYRGS